MMRLRGIAPVAAMALALALAACGGGVKNSKATSSAKAGKTGTAGTSGTRPTATATATVTAGASTPVATATAGASGAVIASTRSSVGLTFEINALKRTSQNIVELDFTAISDAHADSLGAILSMGSKNGDVGAIKLVDEQAQKEYLSVESSDGNCLCSSGLNAGSRGFAANTRGQFYVALTAPPPAVTRIDVVFPIAPPIHNVPISS